MFEDLHWMDPSSRELLDRVMARLDQMPGLLIATCRGPNSSLTGRTGPRVSTLVLPRLGRRGAEALVRALAGPAPLVPDTLDEILERTDGVPLFLEE